MLKRRLQRRERQLKQLLFGRIAMGVGWIGETDVSGIGIGSSASQTVSQNMKDNSKDGSFPGHE